MKVPTPPVLSNTVSPVHCFYMGCVMAGLAQKLPLLNPHLAVLPYRKLTLLACLAYPLLP
ncbi:Cysteine synthase B [Vibrio cholerae]|nr:Cysteine synthase B [Vibrio cholerae]